MRSILVLLSLSACACSSPCAELSLSECAKDDECSLRRGRPVEEETMCLGEAQPAGCSEKQDVCATAIGFARDPSGKLWRFSNLCMPDAWADVGYSEAADWESCATR